MQSGRKEESQGSSDVGGGAIALAFFLLRPAFPHRCSAASDRPLYFPGRSLVFSLCPSLPRRSCATPCLPQSLLCPGLLQQGDDLPTRWIVRIIVAPCKGN